MDFGTYYHCGICFEIILVTTIKGITKISEVVKSLLLLYNEAIFHFNIR